MADLIWRETAPGVEEARAPEGAIFRVGPCMPWTGSGPREWWAELIVFGQYRACWNGRDIALLKKACSEIARWAASCGAAQDRAGRGEVGL